MIAAKSGFHGGKFVKAGQAIPAGTASASESELGRKTKDELVQIAADRGIEVKAGATKADIIAALEA